MTREEYLAKRSKLHPQFDCDLIARLEHEYIARLEADSAAFQARIAELEEENRVFRAADYEALKDAEVQPIYCAKCNDGIVTDDDGICGICAGAQDGVIENLQNKVSELEKQAVVWHRFDIDDCNTYPECGMYLTLSIPERTEYREVDDESVYDVLWFELYSEEYWDKHNVTYYAILPEPPEVDNETAH